MNLDLAFYRSYDAAIGRWLQVDPQSEKYFGMTPYNGMGNNPILIIDPLGDSINVSHIQTNNPDSWTKIKDDLEAFTGLSLSVDDKGNLSYQASEGKLGGSKRARKVLMKAINHKNTVQVKDGPGGGSNVDMDAATLGERNTVNIDAIQLQGFVDGTSSDLDSRTYGFGMNFLHELGHTQVAGSKQDYVNSNGDQLGSNVYNVNLIRRQLGASFGQRVSYNVFNVYSDNSHVYAAFSQSSLQSLRKGEMPSGMFVKFKRK